MLILRATQKVLRLLTGTMVDFAKALPYYLPVNAWDEVTLAIAEEKLWETPCRCGSREVIWPERDTLRLLTLRWSDHVTVH